MKKVEILDTFLEERLKLADWDGYISKDKVSLLRKRIVEDCGFSRSVLYQNFEVRQRLLEIENKLRRLEVLGRPKFGPVVLLDEAKVLLAAEDLNKRLDSLSERMISLLAVVERARQEVKKFSGE